MITNFLSILFKFILLTKTFSEENNIKIDSLNPHCGVLNSS